MGSSGAFWLIVIVGVLAAIGVWDWRSRVHDETGAPHHRVLWFLGTIVGVAVIAFFITLGHALRDGPGPNVSENGRRIENGFVTNAGYIAVTTVALGLYTASHIAEIIAWFHPGRAQRASSKAIQRSGTQRDSSATGSSCPAPGHAYRYSARPSTSS